MPDYGLKVSLPGFDVKTCTPEQCAVHSSYPSPKLALNHFGLLTYTFASEPTIGTHNLYTIAHGYSYTPAALVFMQDVNGYNSPEVGDLYILPFDVVFTFFYGQFIVYTDSTNLIINLIVANTFPNPITGDSFKFRYYLFSENGA